MSTWRPSEPGRSERDPRRIAESLDRVTGTIGAPKAATLSTVFARWEEFVGPDIASHATPRSLRDGVLLVEVDQPAWAAQLGFLAAQILSKLQAATGPDEVGEIRFRVAGAGPRRNPRKNS